MKFKTLVGKNFKNYENLEFSPEKTTCAFVGQNGKGKTSLLQMIQYGLTGLTPDNPVMFGRDVMSVEVKMPDDTSFERIKSNSSPSKVKVNGKTATAKALATYIEATSGVPLESIKLSSSADLIDNLNPAEFGDFIMTYIPEDLDYETVKSYMGPVDPKVFVVLDDEDVIPQTDKFGYDQLSKTYDILFEKRKTTKAIINALTQKNLTASTEPPKYTVEEIDDKLNELFKKEAENLGYMKTLKAYEEAVASRKIQDKQLADLEAKISANTSKRSILADKEAILKRRRELDSSIISLNTTIRTLKANIETFETTIKNLDSPYCPLSKGLVCKTDKTAKRKEFEDQIADNKKAIESIEKELSEKRALREKNTKEEEAFNANDKAYSEKIILIQQRDNLKKSLITIPAKPEVKKFVDYSEEKKNLQNIRIAAIKYAEYEKDQARLKTLSVEKDVLDTLVKLFAPKGDVALNVTKYYFGVFEDLCNERASQLKPGFSLKFVPNEGVEILCETQPGRGYIPYKNCSSGERAYVIFILMDLISNALTKSNIMILDDLDKLDSEAFEALIKCIMQPEIQDEYDHIFICAVDHKDTLDTLAKYPDIQLLSF